MILAVLCADNVIRLHADRRCIAFTDHRHCLRDHRRREVSPGNRIRIGRDVNIREITGRRGATRLQIARQRVLILLVQTHDSEITDELQVAAEINATPLYKSRIIADIASLLQVQVDAKHVFLACPEI